MARQGAHRSRRREIGKLQDVHVDVENDEPQFATVKEGFIGRHLTFVPLGGITVGPDDLQVAVTREQVKSAPNIEQHGEELCQADESALYHHYELNYTPPTADSGPPTRPPLTHGGVTIPRPGGERPAALRGGGQSRWEAVPAALARLQTSSAGRGPARRQAPLDRVAPERRRRGDGSA